MTTADPILHHLRTADRARTAVDATFVLCVESGPLESQTVMAVESLRRWGGRFAGCPVMAVTPRRGAPLSRDTRTAFDRLGVSWHSFHATHGADWYGPMNKPAALEHAERLAVTDSVIWADSDVLFIGEPSELALEGCEEFAALPASRIHDLASDGKNEHETFWRSILPSHGLDPDIYPTIPGHPGEPGRVRMYWQGGVFAYRRDSRLGAAHLAHSSRQLAIRVASKVCGAYFSEQVALALAVARKRLNHRTLSQSSNLMVNPLVEGRLDPAAIAGAKVIHYFGSLWEGAYGPFVDLLAAHRPDVAEWVRSHGPLRDQRPLWRRGVGRIVRHRRQREGRRYLAGCALR